MNANNFELKNTGVSGFVDTYLGHFYSCGVLPHEIINNQYVTSYISEIVSTSLAELKEKNSLIVNSLLPEVKTYFHHSYYFDVLTSISSLNKN